VCERLTDDEVRRMLLYCEAVKDSMYRVEVFANWQIKAMRELLDLRAEVARLRVPPYVDTSEYYNEGEGE